MTPRNHDLHGRAGVEYARDALEIALHAAGLPLSLYVRSTPALAGTTLLDLRSFKPFAES
ncbi:hypothetical protein [Streptomyces daliensis]|uniref:Uncharacterized protein n=1 Tax=Streptomyces daliensis TaxID=299421 RepID=A0A8T4IVX9_9ACTN|nr:hypothetical protein [Streptomyces daliensis]